MIWTSLSLSLDVSLLIDSQTHDISARLPSQSSGFQDILHFEGRTFGVADRFKPLVRELLVKHC